MGQSEPGVRYLVSLGSSDFGFFAKIVTSDRLKTALLLLALPSSCLVAETLGLLSASFFVAAPAHAADFAHAKQIIVPSSRIRRRYDSEMRESSPYMNPGNGSAVDGGYSSYSQSSGMMAAPMPYSIAPPAYSGSSSSTKSKNGLIPPPPPVTPSIVTPPTMGMMTPMSQPTGMTPRMGFESLNAQHANAVSGQVAHATAQLNTLLKENKFPEAQALIKNYLKAFPKDQVLKSEFVQTLIANGKNYVASKDFDDAIKTAREALTIEPHSTTATAMLNDWLKKKGVDHSSDGVRLKMADTLAREGKTNEALVEYRAALKLKPSAEGHVGAGAMLFKEGKKETAKAEFHKALEIDPNSSNALRHLGSLRYTQGDVIGANNDLSRALIINPEDKTASRTLIDLWHRQVAKNPRDASQHLGLARAYQLSGDLKSSQNEYKQVVRLEPDNPNLPAARQSFKLAMSRQEAMKAYQAAQTLETNGAVREAHSKIVEASGIAPTDTKIRLYEGDLAAKLGLYSQAHDAYMTVIREEPKNAIAAKKLQLLTAKMSTSVMPQTAPQAGLASPSVLGLLNQQGGQQSLLSQLSSQMRPGELPPSPTLATPAGAAGSAAAAAASVAAATPTDNHISSISGFLGQLRGFQQTEKDRLQKYEDTTHKALGYKKDDGGGASALGLPPLPALPPMSSIITAETPATASATAAPAVSSISSSATGASASSAAAAETIATASSLTSALPPTSTWVPSAASAASSLVSSTPSSFMPPTAQPSAASAGSSSVASGSEHPVNLLPPISPVPQAAPDFTRASAQAAVLRAATETAGQPALGALGSTAATNAVSATGITSATAQALTPDMINNLASLPPSVQAAMTKGLTPDQLNAVKKAAKQIDKTNASNSSKPSKSNKTDAPVATASNSLPPGRGSVRFELEGVVPSRSQVKLKVVLKNDSDFPMELPSSISAKIHMPGRPPQIAKLEVSGKQIAPHGQLHGIIKVPGGDLNASADVFLPNFLPPSEQFRDVHLTVPISKL